MGKPSLPRFVKGATLADVDGSKMHKELLSLDGSEEPPNLQLSSQKPRHFGPPLERRDADLMIRSCDQVDFQVHKSILGIASVAFEDMFTALGRRQTESVVNLTEDSKTLHRLLTAIVSSQSHHSGDI